MGLIIIFLLVLSAVNIPFASAQTDYGDINLSGSESLIISGNARCDNLTISEDATLIVEDGSLQVHGIIRMSDSARLFIMRSTFKVMPPPLNDDVMVIHVTDNCMINAKEGSSVVFDPQPTATNISYMLIEDQSTFFLVDSYFSGDLPAIINQSIEIASVTAGVYLLSGYASWYIINSDVRGTLNYQGGLLSGRWFWCSLHQRTKLSIEDSLFQLVGSSAQSTMLKPVSGNVVIKNSTMPGGVIDAEVTAELTLTDSVFHKKVEFKDQSKAQVVNCTFKKDVRIGTALSEVETLSNPEAYVEITNGTFDNYLTCKANSTTIITESSIKTMIINDNATVDGEDLHVGNLLSVKDHSVVKFINGSVPLISLDDTAYLSMEGDIDVSDIGLSGSGVPKITSPSEFYGVDIGTIAIYSGSLCTLTFDNVMLGNITFENEMNVTFECMDTKIGRVRPAREGINTTLNFINVNSAICEFDEINDNVTVNVFYRLMTLVYLNLLPQESHILITDVFNNEWVGTTESGEGAFDLPSWSIIKGETIFTCDYQVMASYLGFSETKDIELRNSKSVVFLWVDEKAPDVTNIHCTPESWNMGKEIIVRVEVRDEDVMSIPYVNLVYSIDSGAEKEVSMFKIDEDVYETAIPCQGKRCEITYFIKTEDMAGNQVTTRPRSVSIGEEENFLFLVSLIILVILISIIIIKKTIDYRKVKRYVNKYKVEGDSK